MAVEYEIGEELDPLEITWLDADGGVRNFASGWTFEFKLGTLGQAALLTKTSGITGNNNSPNVVIDFAVDELTVPAGSYKGQLRARNAANKDLFTQFDMTINAVVT
jgi:hypothetical protein